MLCNKVKQIRILQVWNFQKLGIWPSLVGDMSVRNMPEVHSA